LATAAAPSPQEPKEGNVFKAITLATVSAAALVSAGAGAGHPQPGGCPTVPWSLAQARACAAATPTVLVKHTAVTCPTVPWSVAQARACR
jgi:hypothetical protein